MKNTRKKVLSWLLAMTLMITSLIGVGAVNVAAAFAPGDIVRVNCGSDTDYTDTLGNVWAADRAYDAAAGWGYTGTVGVDNPPRYSETIDCANYDVINSNDDLLYKVQRNCTTSAEEYAADNTKPLPELGYSFDVPNGRYKVTLKFNELYEGTEPFHLWEGAGVSPIGKRLVDVYIESALYVNNQDLIAERNLVDPIAPVTDYVANDKTFVVDVNDGQLNINLKAVANRAAIAAIAVEPTTDELSAPVEGGEEPPPDDDDTTPGEAEITVNESVEYQTIDGFGGFGAEKVWWASAPFYTQAFVDRIIDDFGITILRDSLPENFEMVNDNEDPYDTDLSKYNLNQPGGNADGKLADHLDYLRAMKAKGLDKLVVSVWSPPGWMKTNNDVRNGGSLKLECHEEFAEYLVAYIRIIKQQCDIDVYAISLQNELAFVEPYASCVYTPEEYKNILKVVGARFVQEGITIKIFGPEDMGNYYTLKTYTDAITADAGASQYLDILACHGYQQDGITANDPGPYNWTKLSQLAGTIGNKPLWMTETSGFEYTTWDGAMAHNAAIYSALKYGKASAWVFWSLNGDSPSQYSLLFDNTPSLQYYAAKHYYRYIRPGAVQVESATTNEKVAPIAFIHKQHKTMTVVITNSTNAQQTISLNINGDNIPSEFFGYRSSDNEHFRSLGVIGTDSIVLQPKSIITLYGSYGTPEEGSTPMPNLPVDLEPEPVPGDTPDPDLPDGTLLDQPFDNKKLDAAPVGWTLSALSTGTEAKVKDFPDVYNRSLRVQFNTGADSSIEKNFNPQTETVTLEYSVFDQEVNSGSLVRLIDSSTGKVAAKVREFYGVFAVSGESTFRLSGDISNRWYRIKIVADIVNKTYDVYFNDILGVEDVPFDDNSADSIDTVSLGHLNWTANAVSYFDNVKVYGNSSTPPVDTTAPIITLDQTSGTVSEALYTISGSVSEACTLTVNGTAVIVGEDLRFTNTVNLNEGVNTIIAEATDAAENSGTASITVTYQIVPVDRTLCLVLDKGIVIEGGELAVTVKALGVTDLRGFDLTFEYDEALYELVSVQLSSQFGDFESAYFNQTEGNGEVRMLGSLYGGDNRNGDIALVDIKLRAKSGTNSYTEVTLAAGANISVDGNQLYTLETDIVEKAPIANPDIIGNNDGALLNDLVVVAGSFMASAGGEDYDARLDMNKDGTIDIIDIVFVVRQILGI